ncbi:MAG: 3-deoxy-7-phosphoheptulonate synthase [Thermodesulfobacteriota bacterium]
MIIVLKPDASEEQVEHIVERVKGLGLSVHISKGKERTIIRAIGEESALAEQPLEALPGVERVMPILKPYKLVSREFKSEDSVIDIEGVKVGGREVQVIAGPCSVEGVEMLQETAERVKEAGARLLRGGAFKPRTSPYTFQGLGEVGLRYLDEARRRTGLPVVTELMDPRDIGLICEYADVIQIGARNMQNFRLLKEAGKTKKPVLLKRGLSSTIKELLMSAEYIAAEGNNKIMFCERGIRTFETAVRSTLDLSAVPVLKEETHLPVIVDPSHAAGRWDMVAPLAKAAVAIGADGLLVEVHRDPVSALCDGVQSLKPSKFAELMSDLRRIAEAVGKSL